jgi:uncharacterized protein YbjT (DUF2867 family)
LYYRRHNQVVALKKLNMRILITTPTGRIGRQMVHELLAPEFNVRVLAREPAKLPEEVRAEVEVIPGSMEDPVVFRRALEGVEALFFCVPPESAEETEVRGHYERFARVAARAIREARTPRIVTISAIGKGRARNAGTLSALHAMEDILNESGAAMRHLRCGLFMENFLHETRALAERGIISYPMPGHIAIPMVATTDVADTALRWLVQRDWSGVAGISVPGPEDLSFDRAAAKIEHVLGRPVRYQEMAANAFVRSLVHAGASVEYAQSRVAMFAELAAGIAQDERRTFETSTRTTVGMWAKAVLQPAIERHAPAASLGWGA